MKVRVERAAFLKALAHVQSVVERRNTIPILANVMLAANGTALKLTATDMEIAIVEEVAAAVMSTGATTTSATTIYEIVRKLPDSAEIEIAQAGPEAAVALKAGRFATNLLALPVEEFPSMTTGALPCRFNVPALHLRSLIDRTRFAISTEETRYYLNGIYLHAVVTDGRKLLRAVATDGHRLARVDEALPEGAASMPGVIIPRKTISELRKLLDEVSGDIGIGLSDTRIQFDLSGITLTSKLIDGTFPEYERVIPQGNDRIMRVGKKDFSDAVARVAAISSERTKPVKLMLKKDLLTLTATSPDQGSASEELDANHVQYDQAPLEIGFQARYLNDITDQIAGDVEFCFADGAAPTLVRDTANANALFVLMPMRV